jgi:hypothetical protein
MTELRLDDRLPPSTENVSSSSRLDLLWWPLAIPPGTRGQDVKLTIRIQTVPSWRLSGVMPTFPHTTSWHVWSSGWNVYYFYLLCFHLHNSMEYSPRRAKNELVRYIPLLRFLDSILMIDCFSNIHAHVTTQLINCTLTIVACNDFVYGKLP